MTSSYIIIKSRGNSSLLSNLKLSDDDDDDVVWYPDCIVLCCIDGVVIGALMHCDLFKIYCAPPNLGITMT